MLDEAGGVIDESCTGENEAQEGEVRVVVVPGPPLTGLLHLVIHELPHLIAPCPLPLSRHAWLFLIFLYLLHGSFHSCLFHLTPHSLLWRVYVRDIHLLSPPAIHKHLCHALNKWVCPRKCASHRHSLNYRCARQHSLAFLVQSKENE